MKPMLAHTYDGEGRITYPCFVQPKFNGVRALYQNGRFQSRDELPWNVNVLRHIADALLAKFPAGTVLDGELYKHGWPLQKINGAVSIARTEPREDTHEVQFMIFDVVDFERSFGERFHRASTLVHSDPDGPFAFATTMRVHEQREVNSFYAMMVNEGFEGIMYRVGDCPYTYPKQEAPACGRRAWLSDKDNRTWHLLKRKAWQDGEFVCVGVEEGVGKRRGMAGALICLATNGERFRVGSGFTDHEATHYFTNPNDVLGKKIKVKYLTLTQDGKPFNPTIEAIL